MALYQYATVGGNVDLGTRVHGITNNYVATHPRNNTRTVVGAPLAHFILPCATLRSGTRQTPFQQRSRMWRKMFTTCEASPQATNRQGGEAQVIPPQPWRRPGSQVALPGTPGSGRKARHNARQDVKKMTYDGGRNRTFTDVLQQLRDAHVAEDVDEIVNEFSRKFRDPSREWLQIVNGLLFDDETKNRVRTQKEKEERVGEGGEREVGELAQANAAGRGWPLILLVFRSIQSQPFFRPNPLWYSKLISLAGRCMQPEASWQLLLEYQELGLPPDSAVLNAVMKSLARGGVEDKALEVLKGMKQGGGCGATLVSYNIMVAALCRGGREGEAEELVAEMREEGLTPDAYTYTPLIHAYTKTYQWKAADAVLDRVIDEEIRMWSSLPYVSLIRCFRSTRKWGLMERAYTVMVAEGFEVPEVAWKFLLEGFAWAGEMTCVQKLFDQSGVEHTPHVYASLFKYVAKSRAPDSALLAQQLYPYFERFHANPDHTKPDSEAPHQLVPVYTAAIGAFGALGSCDRMAQILGCMVERGVEVEAATFLAMVEGFGKNDMLEEMENIFGVLKEVVVPTADVYRSMLNVYERLEDEERVKEMKLKLGDLKREAKKEKASSGPGVVVNELAVAGVE